MLAEGSRHTENDLFWIAGVGAVLRPRRALRDVTRASPSSAPQPGALHRRRSRKRFVFDARLVCQGMPPDYVPQACVRTLRPVLAHHLVMHGCGASRSLRYLG